MVDGERYPLDDERIKAVLSQLLNEAEAQLDELVDQANGWMVAES